MSRVWSHRACEEFFLQGDRERELGLEVTPAFDRFAISVAKVSGETGQGFPSEVHLHNLVFR